MHNVCERLIAIQSEIKELLTKTNSPNKDFNIIVVCKTFSMNKILPLIENGHIHFGENKVQEAELKWKEIKKKYSNIKLHMVGKLQTNKVKTALEIFDYIHSVDNYKLAEKIVKYEKELDKKVKTFVQVNIGNESQKNGIDPKNTNQFVNHCRNNLSLNIARIYRCVDFWCHLGVVHKLSTTNKFICCSSPDEKHTHIINSCQRCETVFESCNEQMGLNLKKVPESLGLTLVSNSHLEIPVICEACT